MGLSSAVKASKKLGQNFFVDERLAKDITAEILALQPKHILEVGPGTGAFTHLLSKECDRVTAVEKDAELVTYLQTFLPERVETVHQDFLETDLLDYISNETVVFSSLPYNIARKIIEKFVNHQNHVPMFFIIQKEMGQKYISQQELTHTQLSHWVGAWFDVSTLLHIPPSSFSPRPAVQSSLIKMTPKSETLLSLKQVRSYEVFTKSLHQKPRKKILNNLKQYHIDAEGGDIADILNRRPSQISITECISLFEAASQSHF